MKNDRLFAITYTLIHKKTVTASALAKQFQVSVRTIYRDIDTLSSNGIPIYCTQGKGGGISILDHYTIDKTLLTDAEQNEVLMALQSANVTGQLDLNDSITKLAGLFQKNAQNWIEIDFTGWEQNEKDKEVFTMIRSSIQNSTVLSFTYFANNGIQTTRVVEPYKLIFKGTQWYLYAFCKMRMDYRFFKLSRMEQLSTSNDTFSRQKHLPIPDRYESDSCESITLHLQIDKSLAFRVYDEFKQATIVPQKHYLSVEVQVPNNSWLISYLLGYGSALKIIEPVELKEKYLEELKKILNQYL